MQAYLSGAGHRRYFSRRFRDICLILNICFAGAPAKEIRTIGFIILTGFLIAIPTSAATFNVTTTNDTLDVNPGDGNCADVAAACSLRAAISEANALPGADTILLVRGTYTQSIVAANEDTNAGGDWDITSALTIIGEQEFCCPLEAATTPGVASERVVHVLSGGDLTLRNVVVRNGNFSGTVTASTRGAGIENKGILTLDNVNVRNNQITSVSGDPYGAGIHNAGPALTMISTSITANTISQQTGGNAFGGGIASTAETTITITNGFIGNGAFANAGFVFGAGIYLEDRFTLNITGSVIAGSTAAGTSGGPDGGGVKGSGISVVLNRGPAVFNASRSIIRDNSAAGPRNGSGTALYFLAAAADGSTLTATLDGVRINDNAGTAPGGGVGATVNGGRLILNIFNSSITNNIGAGLGGGIYMTDAGPRLGPLSATLNLRNSTISGNVSSDLGGGLYLGPSNIIITANLNHVTIANNTADRVGGIAAQVGSIVNLKNSIVADNFGGFSRDIAGSGTIVSGDYNHIENIDQAVITGITTNNTTGDALLGPLVEHAGGGAVHMPEASSPVLDTIPIGTNGCGTEIVDDQRGVPRPQGGGCDKGSVERAVSATIAGRVTTFDGQGIRNALVTLSRPGLSQPLTTRTSALGYYSFPNLPAEQQYSLTVRATRYEFTFRGAGSRSVYLSTDVLDFQLAADGPFGF